VDIPTSCTLIIILFNGPVEFGDGGIIISLRWMQNVHQSTWDHKLLHAERSLDDEQLLIKPLFRELKNMNMAGG
jgi:hypothetical protein